MSRFSFVIRKSFKFSLVAAATDSSFFSASPDLVHTCLAKVWFVFHCPCCVLVQLFSDFSKILNESVIIGFKDAGHSNLIVLVLLELFENFLVMYGSFECEGLI